LSDFREIIKHSQLFWALDDAQIDRLVEICQEELCEAGSKVIGEGESSGLIFIVAAGSVALQMEIRIGSRTRKQAVIDVTTPGQVFGRSALTEHPVADMSAICIGKTRLLTLDGVKVREMLNADPDMYRKVMQEMLELVTDRLTHAKQTLAHVLSVTSHDLRAPLATVQSCLDVLTGGFVGDINEKQAELINGSKQRITDLTNMIDNILDISFIEMRDLDFETVSLPAVIQSSTGDVQGIADKKNIRMINNVAAGLPDVMGMPKRLQQVTTNLLSNALKFTPEGGSVSVDSHVTQESIRVDISDTGIGIPAEELPRVFDDFYRGMQMEAEGAGLGLAIAKKIIAAHGGNIWVESPVPETGGGTRFSFTIPRVPAAKEDGGEAENVLQGARILVIDDDPALLKVATYVLESRGCEVFTAGDGLEGLEKIAEVKPDLVILDMLMPVMDGFEVLKRLAERAQKTGYQVPVLVTSAVKEESSKRRYELETQTNLSVEAYMEKPYSPPMLLQRVERILQKHRTTE
jgi:signal transduction histidine kinase/AmiR/NasT family two-component response regulator